MSATDQDPVSTSSNGSDGPFTPPRSLEEAGITINTRGHYVLPQITVEYRGGTTRSLLIEVGDQLNQSTTSSTVSGLQTLSDFFRNNATFVSPAPETRSQSEPQATPTVPSTTAQNIPINTTATGNMAATQPHNTSTDSPTNTQNDTTNPSLASGSNTSGVPHSTTPQGIRGLDYPAFDGSMDGNSASRNTNETGNNSLSVSDGSAYASSLLAPLHRVIERIYGRNSNTSNATENAAQNSGSNATTNNSNNNSIENSRTGDTTEIPTASVPADSNGSPSRSGNTLAESRNIILTVNYVYGGSNENPNSDSGSLLLYVPRIDETNDENVSILVRLATEIALRTIAVTLRKFTGVSKEALEKLEVIQVKDLKENENECSICYDPYVDKESDASDSSSKKRKLEDTEDRNEPTKKAKISTGTPVSNADSLSVDPSSNEKPKASAQQYSHYPIKLKCGHMFGISCLSEWFKSNNSCPLCREKVEDIQTPPLAAQRFITITLPNLARVISNSRPLIENFNNRQMTFTMSEEDDPVVPNQANTDLRPLSTPTTAQTQNTNNNADDAEVMQRLANINRGANRRSTRSNIEPRQSLVNFIRDIVSAFGQNEDNRDPRSSSDTSSSVRTQSAIPLIRPFPFGSNRPEIGPLVERRVLRRGDDFPGLFPPLGVESRRTRDGVQTREVGMLESNTTTTMASISVTNNDATQRGTGANESVVNAVTEDTNDTNNDNNTIDNSNANNDNNTTNNSNVNN